MFNQAESDGSESDAWFICVSQEQNSVPTGDSSTSFFNVGISDNIYSYSVHYIYQNWSRCVSTYASSSTSVTILISEVGVEYTGEDVYIKIVGIDFQTGSYSIQTATSPFTSLDTSISSYYTVGA